MGNSVNIVANAADDIAEHKMIWLTSSTIDSMRYYRLNHERGFSAVNPCFDTRKGGRLRAP
jgi:hypothetical protein